MVKHSSTTAAGCKESIPRMGYTLPGTMQQYTTRAHNNTLNEASLMVWLHAYPVAAGDTYE
jgi:hypothetical protein